MLSQTQRMTTTLPAGSTLAVKLLAVAAASAVPAIVGSILYGLALGVDDTRLELAFRAIALSVPVAVLVGASIGLPLLGALGQRSRSTGRQVGIVALCTAALVIVLLAATVLTTSMLILYGLVLTIAAGFCTAGALLLYPKFVTRWGISTVFLVGAAISVLTGWLTY
ncbi:hypothetical protein ASF62_11130 [Leifsonia sp. Leaf325]|nr:hypothetical protein ASF62_11130 [Leifsonia sp. Leaf325]